MSLARWIDTARAVRDARDSATAHVQENVRLRRLVAERDRQLAELRRDNDRLRAREPISVDTLQLGHRAEQAEAMLADLGERHETLLRLVNRYVHRFGDITQEATAEGAA